MQCAVVCLCYSYAFRHLKSCNSYVFMKKKKGLSLVVLASQFCHPQIPEVFSDKGQRASYFQMQEHKDG